MGAINADSGSQVNSKQYLDTIQKNFVVANYNTPKIKEQSKQ